VFSLALRRSFTARHFLIGGDWGPENLPHSHDYRLEVELEGDRLDRHGFLVDLVELGRMVDATLDQYRGQSLNQLASFRDLNPSLEQFCRILCSYFDQSLQQPGIRSLTVRLWEDEGAWASFRTTKT